jgi:8-oxo-dGTP pyrophosphatase MutT (NUDIX family)
MPDHVLRLRERVGGDLVLQLPSAAVAARDAQGRVLLVRHAIGAWVLPGGSIEPGEVPADTAVREMWEETGLVVRLTRLVGVYGGADYLVRYPNGDRTSYVMSLFEALVESGTPRPDGEETLELRFVDEDEASALAPAGWMPEVLRAVFRSGAGAGFRAPTWVPPGPTPGA